MRRMACPISTCSSAPLERCLLSSKRGTAMDGAVTVSPGVWLYQITGRGLAAQLTISGTKYYRDDDLN